MTLRSAETRPTESRNWMMTCLPMLQILLLALYTWEEWTDKLVDGPLLNSELLLCQWP